MEKELEATLQHVKEQTLDPEDWDAMRKLGHQMVDDMLQYLEHVSERPIWKPLPEKTKANIHQALPLEPQEIEDVYQDFKENVLPYPMGNIHPRFWGWVMGAGTPAAMLADLLASGMNPNMGGGEHAPNHVEATVIDWCKEMMGYPKSASGLLVSGGSMANFVALTVARNVKAGYNIREEGVHTTSRLMAYASSETHSSVQRSIEVLGLGNKSLRKIPVTPNFEIDIEQLALAIEEDRANGLQPFCIIGNAGATNTGAFDDLNALAQICKEEGLWFHVDGAFGATVAIEPSLAHLVSGMEHADSIAFDLHKWMQMPFEVGCTLIRNKEQHYKAFTLTPDYLKHGDRGLAAGELWFSDYGLQLSRGFRALKVWMSLKEHGLKKFAAIVRQNVDQALYLKDVVEASPELELLAPVPLNIVCFRYYTAGCSNEKLNAINEEIIIQLHERGIAVPTGTTISDRYAIRICITNHRTKREDLDLVVEEIIKIGRELIA